MKPAVRPTHLPSKPGVYLMRDSAARILYVGKARDLRKRVAQYFDPARLDEKIRTMMPLVRRIDYVAAASEREALLLERRLIRLHKPFFNAMWKDDKSYPYVKLTREDYPRLLLTRSRRRDGASYFGPYPQVSGVKGLLRYLWRSRFAPLRPCKWEFSEARPLEERRIKSCLYYHTRECPAPCAGRVSGPAYRRIARRAVLFFGGRYGALKRELERDMREAAKALEFERAASLRDHLDAIGHMAERVVVKEFREEDVQRRIAASRGVSELQAALGLARPPAHVEAFDISHLFGRQQVGAMVCFTDGLARKAHYRHFRIKTVEGSDDFASMREVVGRRYRRLKEEGEALPDLVLIDGGKGQLAAAGEALQVLGLKLPLAALAKREEEVFLPGRPEPVKLPADSPALHLLQRLRDEAHRFGVKLHRKLRIQALLEDAP